MATTKVPSGVDVANAIRNAASPEYQNAVPMATAANVGDVGNPILTYQSLQNEFLGALVNKIALTIVRNKMYDNPLAFLKKGASPLGLDIEDIHVNPSTALDYTPEGYNGILTPNKPDVKATYYRRNRRDMYKVTIANEQLTAAFKSWGALEQLIAAIVNSLYNGNTIGEFTLTKQLLGGAVSVNKLNQIALAAPTTEATATAFLTSLRATSSAMQFPSSTYTNWAKMGGTGTAAINWAPPEEQVIIVRADVAANVDVQKLSAAFNLSYADYVARQIVVDKFDGADNMYAFVGSRNIFQIWENLRKMTDFYNSQVMAWSYWWHCWDTYALSPYEVGVAYVTQLYPTPEPDPGDGG